MAVTNEAELSPQGPPPSQSPHQINGSCKKKEISVALNEKRELLEIAKANAAKTFGKEIVLPASLKIDSKTSKSGKPKENFDFKTNKQEKKGIEMRSVTRGITLSPNNIMPRPLALKSASLLFKNSGSIPKKRSLLFSECLEPILVETKERKKVLPSLSRKEIGQSHFQSKGDSSSVCLSLPIMVDLIIHLQRFPLQGTNQTHSNYGCQPVGVGSPLQGYDGTGLMVRDGLFHQLAGIKSSFASSPPFSAKSGVQSCWSLRTIFI